MNSSPSEEKLVKNQGEARIPAAAPGGHQAQEADFDEVGLTVLPGDDTYRIVSFPNSHITRVGNIDHVHQALYSAKVTAEAENCPAVARVRTTDVVLKQAIADLDGNTAPQLDRRKVIVAHVVDTDRSPAEIASNVKRILNVAVDAQDRDRPPVIVRVKGVNFQDVERVIGAMEGMNQQLKERAGTTGASRDYLIALREGEALPARTPEKRPETTTQTKKSDVIELSSRGDLKATLNEIRERLKARHERVVEYGVQSMFQEDGAQQAAPNLGPVHVRVRDLKAARALLKLKPDMIKEFGMDAEQFDRDVLKVTYTQQVVRERDQEKQAKAAQQKTEAPAAETGGGWLSGARKLVADGVAVVRKWWPWGKKA